MTTEQMMMRFPITRKAWLQAGKIWIGIAIPHQPSLADGEYGPIRSEKILKFNRQALKNLAKKKSTKTDPRMIGGDDTMIVKVGQPGSDERVQALTEQYAAIMSHGEEISPFSWKGNEE